MWASPLTVPRVARIKRSLPFDGRLTIVDQSVSGHHIWLHREARYSDAAAIQYYACEMSTDMPYENVRHRRSDWAFPPTSRRSIQIRQPKNLCPATEKKVA